MSARRRNSADSSPTHQEGAATAAAPTASAPSAQKPAAREKPAAKARAAVPAKPVAKPAAKPLPIERDPNGLAIEFTQSAVASFFNTNRRTVVDWFNRGCPKSLGHAISLWREAFVRRDRRPADDATSQDAGPAVPSQQSLRVQAEIERIEHDTRLKKLKYLEKSGELVRRSDVVRETAAVITRLKERLLAAPDEFETRFPAEVREQCKSDFVQFIRGLLCEFSSWRIADFTSDDIILKAADQIIRKRDAELVMPKAGLESVEP